ncbi:MAG: AAA family ATPase [Mogibacterium sp.]|nr:AAA family ATPase [Oscillospiraceae bacterium]MBR3124753.1 AAA family ATPase [Mogibacterium sp.]
MNNMEPTDKKEQLLLSFDDINAEEIHWLWYPYIPLGKVTILQGDPGCGKTMVALDLAARLSSGTPLPFTSEPLEPLNVIYQTAEDGLGDTIKPRLETAGADCSKIMLINDNIAPVTFSDERLEKAVKESNAKFMILDPLSAFIGNDVNLNHAIDVRKAFRPLYEMADRTKCAVLIISHTNKMRGISSLHRTNGSIDVAAAVRSILAVGKRRDEKTERILVQVKNNLAQIGPSLIYELTDHIDWTEQSNISADDLFAEFVQPTGRRTKKDIAKEELIELLMEKDQPQRYIKAHFDKMGIGFRTVQEAQNELGIKTYRQHNQSFWSFPPTTQQ